MQEIQFDFEKVSKKDSHDEEHNSSEIFVHQIIETIEFVLGIFEKKIYWSFEFIRNTIFLLKARSLTLPPTLDFGLCP
jgi:hypothetical protein